MSNVGVVAQPFIQLWQPRRSPWTPSWSPSQALHCTADGAGPGKTWPTRPKMRLKPTAQILNGDGCGRWWTPGRLKRWKLRDTPGSKRPFRVGALNTAVDQPETHHRPRPGFLAASTCSSRCFVPIPHILGVAREVESCNLQTRCAHHPRRRALQRARRRPGSFV